MRALILSAPVGAGHDAAARGVAAELEARGYRVEIDDGLALLGRHVERFVIDGYRLQLDHAAWSWRILYKVTRSARLMRLVGAALALHGGARLVDRIDRGGATLVVSTYPLVSAALAGLRRAGHLRMRCAAIVTDVDPHPAWIHEALDANLTVGAATSAASPVRPPLAAAIADPTARDETRTALRISRQERVVLIVGGAWGVGDLAGATRAALAAGARPIVVCGRNDALREQLLAADDLAGATVLGFVDDLPQLMAASDALVQNAGGLTCLEAFRIALPVVMYRPLAGHGEANARLMARRGLVSVAPDRKQLSALLTDPGFWTVAAPAATREALTLFDQPPCGDLLDCLAPPIRPRRVARRLRQAAAVVVIFAVFTIADAPSVAGDPAADPNATWHASP